MRLFVLAFLLLMHQPPQPPSAQSKEHKPDSNSSNTAQVPAVNQSIGDTDKEGPTHYSEHTDPYDARKDCLYRWYMKATIVGVIGGCAGVIVLICQTVLTRRSTDAAKKAADAALLNAQAVINSERPWILVSVENEGRPSRHPGIAFKAKNCGRTPARVTRYSVFYIPHVRDSDFPAEPEYQQTELRYWKYVIPDESFIVNDFSLDAELTEEMWTAMKQRNEQLTFIGHVVYADLISGKEHETRFCYYLSTGGTLIMTGPRHYNQHT